MCVLAQNLRIECNFSHFSLSVRAHTHIFSVDFFFEFGISSLDWIGWDHIRIEFNLVGQTNTSHNFIVCIFSLCGERFSFDCRATFYRIDKSAYELNPKRVKVQSTTTIHVARCNQIVCYKADDCRFSAHRILIIIDGIYLWLCDGAGQSSSKSKWLLAQFRKLIPWPIDALRFCADC